MNKKITIKDKVALVTGSNRGIGKAITEELLSAGAKKVYATARDTNSLNELKKQFGERLVPVKLDVTNDEDIEKINEFANEIEILVNNAGAFYPGTFSNNDLNEGLIKNLEVNVFGLIKVTQIIFDSIKDKSSGAIASISSVIGFANMPSMSAYGISKAAVHSLTQGLRGELKESNILVSGIYPGPIDTDMAKMLDMEKETPTGAAKNILAGLENGDEYICPDPMSKNVGTLYLQSPLKVEENFQGM